MLRRFPVEGSVPVHRFHNLVTGGHFYTSFELEKNNLILAPEFNYEGESFRGFSAHTPLPRRFIGFLITKREHIYTRRLL